MLETTTKSTGKSQQSQPENMPTKSQLSKADIGLKSKEPPFTYIKRRGRPQTDSQGSENQRKNKELKMNLMIPSGEGEKV